MSAHACSGFLSYRSDPFLLVIWHHSFAIFMVTVMPALIIAQIEPQFIMSRMTFYREASSKMYSSEVFALSQILAEMPYR